MKEMIIINEYDFNNKIRVNNKKLKIEMIK